MNVGLLTEGARGFGLELDSVAIERFSQFLDELRRWNRTINLTAITKPDQIVIKHFVDSLSIVPHLEQGERLLDIGSGAGLPGLAVAVVRNDLTITSLDAVEKKTRFQRHVCRLLGLERVMVVHERVEQLAEKHAGQYDVVTSRAFRDIERFVLMAHHLVRPGGRLVAMLAGELDDHDAVVARICSTHAFAYVKTEYYRLPQGMGKRCLVVLKRNVPAE